jgi:DNA-binding response OmpR family regulator
MCKPKIVKTILIVDDDEDARIMCERELRDGGYDTHSASSGSEALQLIEENPRVDLIILDIKMPSMDGIEVLKRLRAKNVNVPVILYSDYSAYRSNFLSWLADAYLVKSSDLTELKEKVTELLKLSG